MVGYSIAARPPPDHQSDAFETVWNSARELFCACHAMNRKRLSAYLFPPVKVSWAHLIHLWTFSRFHIPSPFIYHTVSLATLSQSSTPVCCHSQTTRNGTKLLLPWQCLCLRGTCPIIAKNKNQMLPTCIYVTFSAIISCSFHSRVIWLRLFRVGFGWASTVGYERRVWRNRCHLWIYGKEGHL